MEVESTIESVEPGSRATIVSPEVINPHPVAPPKKANTKTRKRRKSCILTDTLENEKQNRKWKTQKQTEQKQLDKK